MAVSSSTQRPWRKLPRKLRAAREMKKGGNPWDFRPKRI
jgi:hypothetical protein